MPDRPNVIYILGDDQRGDHLGCAGHPVLNTPNIDQLAREGTRFANAFCTSSLCTPSRVCHYLGQWERKHGVNFNSGTAVAPEAWEESFPMRLKRAGYFLGWVGKNHVPAGEGGYGGGYLESVFDFWYGNHGHSTFYPKELGAKGEIYRNAALDTQVEVFAEGVRNFLSPRQPFLSACTRPLPRRPDDRPFCLCVTFNLPHCASTGAMQLRPSDDELYKCAYRDRCNDMPSPPTYKAWGQDYHKLPEHVWNGVLIPSYDFVRTPHALREQQVRTCQTITGVDRMIGEMREQLDRLGLAGNTIIVFSTDHGLHFGEHGLGGKTFLYEPDLRIPLVVYDPRVPPAARGQAREEMVVVEDLAPTVLEACGLQTPSAMQGRSLVPLLLGQRPEWRDAFFAENLFDHQNYPRCEAVRTGAWKYIRYFARTEDPAQAHRRIRGTCDPYETTRLRSLRGEQPVYEELYDLATDAHEEQNLASETSASGTLNEMRRRIIELGLAALDGHERAITVPTQSSWASRRP